MNDRWFAIFSFSHHSFTQDVEVLTAAAVMLTGMWLCWGAPRFRMSMEERAKDGHITEAQARRKIQAMEWAGPALVILGAGILAYALMH